MIKRKHADSPEFPAPFAPEGRWPMHPVRRGHAVVPYFSPTGEQIYDHEKAALRAVARAIADAKQCDFIEPCDHSRPPTGHVYFVPDDALLPDEAAGLGVTGPDDLFGSVVPHPFVRTKAITHELVGPDAGRPPGWRLRFGEQIRDVVLPGYTAFDHGDALQAARKLLASGPGRLKEPLAARGDGQVVVASIRDVESFLDRLSPTALATSGLVIEMNLANVRTLSVGRLSIDGMVVTYHGTQRVVPNNAGRMVYGGSDLMCVRGDWNALDAMTLPAAVRIAIAQAKAYEQAAAEYAGLFASRSNYDIAQGFDSAGRWRSGVLESSWRVGGSSTAELAAFAAFREDPDLRVVSVSSLKLFGKRVDPPPPASVYYRGEDPEDGPIVRYTVITDKQAGSHRPAGVLAL